MSDIFTIELLQIAPEPDVLGGPNLSETEAIATLAPVSFSMSLMSLTIPGPLTVTGTADDDAIAGSDADGDVLKGMGGNDNIIGTANSDTTQDGSDLIEGGDGYDTIYGFNGNDTIDGGAGYDRIYGGQGDDRITDLIGGSYVEGGKGDDWIQGGNWYTTLNGGNGQDTLLAGSWGAVLDGWGGNDSLVGGAGNDTIQGHGDRDTLRGGGGVDWLDGMQGMDTLYGGDGSDILIGGTEADKLYGERGDDALYDGPGNDTLSGDDGNDRLVAMEGKDVMVGGAGADLFDFRRSSFEFTDADKINDFVQGEDRIFIGYDQDAADIIAHAVRVGTALVLTIGDGNTAALQSFKGTLTESDFLYG